MKGGPPNFGIIVAAGRGRRFRGLKQFARIKGKPLLFYSVRAFERCPAVAGFVIVTNRSRVAAVKKMFNRYRMRKLRAVIPGGKLRMDSVEQGLRVLPEEGYVAIHDGVRPLLTPQMLIQGFRLARRYPAVAYGIPITNTIKEVSRGKRVIRTVERKNLVAVQTPQFFPLSLIRNAYAQARAAGLSATDDCQVVEHLKLTPLIIPGSSLNIKVTTREDLRICKALL